MRLLHLTHYCFSASLAPGFPRDVRKNSSAAKRSAKDQRQYSTLQSGFRNSIPFISDRAQGLFNRKCDGKYATHNSGEHKTNYKTYKTNYKTSTVRVIEHHLRVSKAPEYARDYDDDCRQSINDSEDVN